MNYRICSKCKKEKAIDEFNYKIKSKNIRQYHCKNCSRLYIRSHYLKNINYYLNKAAVRNSKILIESKNFIYEFLSNHPCVDCGESDIIVLEFDHLENKIMNVSKMITGRYSLDTIKLEIAKCEVRCANCHRRKTAKQLGWNKLPL